MQYTILLVVAALLANADASLEPPTATDLQRLVHSTIVSQGATSTTRLLRVHKSSSHDDDERVITAPSLETVANSIKSTVSVEKLHDWPKKGESADNVFKLLTLDKAADDFLAHPNVNAWINYIKLFNEENPTKRASLIATLTAQYGDDGLAKIIEAAKRVPSTEDIAKRVQTEQLQRWLVGQKSTDEVFGLLALDKAADSLLASPQLNTWISYMKLFNEKNPTKKTSLIATLTAHYGDKGLTKIVEAAERVPSTATIAKRVQNEQIQRWLGHGKTPDKVFAMLNLDEAGTHFFMHPQMNTWVKYTDDFNKAYPDTEITLLSVLSKRFKEETVVQMLIAAKKIPSMENLAVKIQAEQTKLWLSAGKSPADVFALLRLNYMYEGNTLFSSPLFTAWVKYTEEYRMINFGSEFTIIGSMKKYFNMEILATMILNASKKTSTSSIAKRLETELLREWSITLQTPGQVFTSLHLPARYSVLEHPLFPLWSKYVTYFSEVEPSFKVTLLSQLRKIFGESNLSKVLVRAQKVPKTKQIATELLDEQLSVWLSQLKDPVAVYKLLRVEGAATNDANRLLYVKYVKDYVYGAE